MRLRQLARKMGVQPEKILEVLSENGHVLENEANSKLTDEQVALATETFGPIEAPEQETETSSIESIASIEVVEEKPVLVEPFIEVETRPEKPVEESIEEESTEDISFGPPAHATSQPSEASVKEEKPLPKKIQLEPERKVFRAYEEDEALAEAELIETETPKLEGLKVLGKIELPEPKKPEPKKEEEEEEKNERSNNRNRNGRSQNGRGRKGNRSKERLNPVEYERRKAERIAQKKKKEAEQKLKEKKREHYLSTVKTKTAPAKKKKESIEEEIAPLPINGMSRPEPQKKKPAGPKRKKGLRKLWAWLNGEYDKF